MKHKHHMSLIARRAQIRRAASHRKDLQPDGPPVLRLVASAGSEPGQPPQNDRREAAPAAIRERPFSP